MKFIYEDNIITCLPLSHETDASIKLVNHSLFFEGITSHHPDILALICVISFYPFLTNSKEIIFPKPISTSLHDVLKQHKLHIHSASVNQLQKPRKITNPKRALSWGGGFDSTAMLLLQPYLYDHIIHQEIPDRPVPPLQKHQNTTFLKIHTNLRQLTSEEGWTVWPQALVGALWVADQYELNLLGLGGNLGSVFMNDGKRYHPTHLRPNLWYETFRAVDMTIYLPLAGLTDLGVVKILKATGADFSKIKYCSCSVTTSNCHDCPKCLRKELILGRDLSNNKKALCELIKAKGPTIDYILHGHHGNWIDKYYAPALMLISDESLKSSLKQTLSEIGIEYVPRELEIEIEHYGY